MKVIKMTKKSMIILISVILLIAIGVIITSIAVKKVNNPYGVKVVDLPMEYEHYNFGGNFFQDYIESADEFNNIFDKRHAELSEEQKKNYKSDKRMFRKYDDKFFEKNFIYVLKTKSKYYGGSEFTPRLKMTKCFYLQEKERLIIEAKAIGQIQPKNVPAVVLPGKQIFDPHGYIIEFPRSVFEEHDLTYDNIQIIYTNIDSGYNNSQLGLDRYLYNPNYPSPKYLSGE